MLLSRSQRANLNQENPTTHRPAAGTSSALHPTKTPARQQAAAAGPSKGLTGGKGLGLTAKGTNRVLGNKDANLGKTNGTGSGAGGSSLLFPGKPSTSKQAAGACLPSHLRTPSPGVHKFAPMAFSPEVEVEMEPEAEESEEMDLDREVEYAGGSSKDYDEPYQPDFPLPDFATADFGGALRGMPFGGPRETLEEWQQRDEEERKAFKAELDDVKETEPAVDPLFDASQPTFPVPKRHALSDKSTNAKPSLVSQPRLPSTKSAIATARKPAATHTIPARKPLAPSTISRKPATSTPGLSSTVRKPLVSASASKPTWGSSASKAVASKPVPTSRLNASTARLPASSLSAPELAATGRVVKVSASSTVATARAEDDDGGSLAVEEERELGIFGVEQGGLELLLADESLEHEEGFAFEV